MLSALSGFLSWLSQGELNKSIIQIHKEIEMATQKDNLLVSLLKRSVGMSSGASGCCGAPPACGCASGTSSEAAPGSADAAGPAAPEPDAGAARADRPRHAGSSGCC